MDIVSANARSWQEADIRLSPHHPRPQGALNLVISPTKGEADGRTAAMGQGGAIEFGAPASYQT
jgi:hypothetical protein